MTHNIIHDEIEIVEIINKYRQEYWKISGDSVVELERKQDEYIVNILKQYAEHYLIKHIDGEIERLEKERKSVSHDSIQYTLHRPGTMHERYMETGKTSVKCNCHNETITDQITHLTSLKAELTKKE